MILQKFMVLLLGLLSTMSIIAAELSNLDMSYRRVLPLENGSNFRDAGDYPTIDGKRVNHFSEVSDILIASSNSSVNLVIKRKGEIKNFYINTEISEDGTPILGISAAYKRSITEAFVKSVKDTYNLSVKTLLFIASYLS